MSYKGPDVSFHFVNVSNVKKCIEDLKRGKAAGCGDDDGDDDDDDDDDADDDDDDNELT